jgi:hypothetical protein
VRYKDAGFCSKECYEASKKVVEPVVDLEPIVEEITTVEIEETNETSIEEVQSIEIEAEVNTEAPIVEEPTIKKETNTYKKKKNKYKYTSSY